MPPWFVPALGVLLIAGVIALSFWDGVREEKRETAILAMLLFSRELAGLEMVKQSNGLLRRGTVYITLGNLEKRGLLASREEDAAFKRRFYRLTYAGREVAVAKAKLKGAAVE